MTTKIGQIFEMLCSVQNIRLWTESKKPVILIVKSKIYHQYDTPLGQPSPVQEQWLSQILRVRNGNFCQKLVSLTTDLEGCISRQAWKPEDSGQDMLYFTDQMARQLQGQEMKGKQRNRRRRKRMGGT
jgi:hypothetical protein